jgi:hypothetical protein
MFTLLDCESRKVQRKYFGGEKNYLNFLIILMVYMKCSKLSVFKIALRTIYILHVTDRSAVPTQYIHTFTCDGLPI